MQKISHDFKDEFIHSEEKCDSQESKYLLVMKEKSRIKKKIFGKKLGGNRFRNSDDVETTLSWNVKIVFWKGF